MWLVHMRQDTSEYLVVHCGIDTRPDSKVVVGWATGLTAARTSNHELASNLKRAYTCRRRASGACGGHM